MKYFHGGMFSINEIGNIVFYCLNKQRHGDAITTTQSVPLSWFSSIGYRANNKLNEALCEKCDEVIIDPHCVQGIRNIYNTSRNLNDVIVYLKMNSYLYLTNKYAVSNLNKAFNDNYIAMHKVLDAKQFRRFIFVQKITRTDILVVMKTLDDYPETRGILCHKIPEDISSITSFADTGLVYRYTDFIENITRTTVEV